MDGSDVGRAGLAALAGAATALGPAAAPVALLLLTLDQLLSLEGGTADAPAPSLTGDAVKGIIKTELLYQDVRQAWSDIAVAFDFHTAWVRRAKHGEVFSAADQDDFYRVLPDKIDAVKRGIGLLYSGTADRSGTPGQYGLPYLIIAVGVLVRLRECELVRVAARGETVSTGELHNFFVELQGCANAIESCERLARQHVDEAVRRIRTAHPQLGPDDPQVAKKVQSLERDLLGGDSATGTLAMPAMIALRDLYAMMSRLDEEMRRSAGPPLADD